MTNAVLHIGFGKTGTTALQSFLSFNPILEGKTQSYEYVSIDRTGELITDTRLASIARASPFLSVSSAPDLEKIECLASVGRALKEHSEKSGRVIVLSQEDWARRVREFNKGEYLKKLGLTAHVVIYVRPQVEWFQSGWWQWWAWDEQFSKPEDLINKWGTGFLKWHAFVRAWEEIENVNCVSVRLHSSDVVRDFLGILGISNVLATKPNEVINPTLGASAIKLLRTFPSLRGPYDGHIDVALNKLLPGDDKAPWVVSPELVQRIIDDCRQGNLELAERLPDASRARMLQDLQWWDASCYSGREAVSMSDMQLATHDLKIVAERVLKALLASKSN